MARNLGFKNLQQTGIDKSFFPKFIAEHIMMVNNIREESCCEY